MQCGISSPLQEEVAEKEKEAASKKKLQEFAGTARQEADARADKANQEYKKAFARANPGAAIMVWILTGQLRCSLLRLKMPMLEDIPCTHYVDSCSITPAASPRQCMHASMHLSASIPAPVQDWCTLESP